MSTLQIRNITCEHMENPLSIAVPRPRFSWEIVSDSADCFQKSYRILVTAENQGVVWDSKTIESRDTIDIAYEGEALSSCSRYQYQVFAETADGQTAESAPQYFETAFLSPSDWKADWIEPDPLPQLAENPLITAQREWAENVAAMMRGDMEHFRIEGDILDTLPLEPYDPAVRLRREFSCSETPCRARLYVTAHGIYDIRLNGKAVTDSRLNPGFTTYDKRIKYQVYDVDSLLLSGANAISATIADGWYKGKIALGRGCEYGEVPGLLLQMLLLYADGHTELVCSDNAWTYSYDGPVRSADLFLGETYDARMEDGDSSCAGYDAKNWKPVLVKSKEDTAQLPVPQVQTYPMVKVFKEIPAQKIWTAPNGDTLVDFGQNMAGVVRVQIHGTAGETITLEHGETLDKDGNFYYVFSDTPKAQKDIYICRGDKEEIFEPLFTYHGFRYVRVTGGKGWKPEHFTALAISTDNPVTGSFCCSDADLNKLQQNIYWSQRSNNIGIPTDCPTREKAGWTGDIVVYGATALFNQEMTAFYKDWLTSVRTEQRENGQILGTVPQIKNYVSQSEGGSLGWGDVILTLPWQLYTLCGNATVLEENYEAMGKWMSAMETAAYELPNAFNTMTSGASSCEGMEGRQLDNQHYLINTGFHFGDWIIPSVVNEQGFSDGPASSFLTMCYCDTALLAHIADLYAQISALLGYTENAEKYTAYATRVREVFLEEYVTADHRLGQEMQGNYILALKYHMVPDEIAVEFAARLNELITENGCCLDTGFMSTPHILDILCDYGYSDTAWKVLAQRKCPSWLYEIDHGATTLWENWDAIRPDGLINDCSFNHYAFGCVGDFLYRRVLGIQNEGIAYDRILIAPEYDCPLDFAEGCYHSARGEIQVRWEKQDSHITICGSVPANTSARLKLPDGTIKELGNGNFSVSAQI